MLKKTLFVLTVALISSRAFAESERNWHLFEPGAVVVQPGQAALIQVAPRVVYAPVPAPVSQPDYSQPADTSEPAYYPEPADEPQPVYHSQPSQNARLK